MYQDFSQCDDPLVGAMLTSMASGGARSATARSVAAQAGVSAALVSYRFGGMVGLTTRAHEAADALALAAWEQRRQWLDLSPGWPDLSALLLAVARDVGAAQVALWRVSWMDRCARLRRPHADEHGRKGEQACLAFWHDVACRLDLPDGTAAVLAGFADGLAFGYGITGGDPAFDMWASALATRFSDRLAGNAPAQAPDSPYRLAAEGGVGQPESSADPGGLHPTRQAILEAAVRVVVTDGTEALTHRALAAQAGVSLSSVQHFLPRRSDILRATYETVYRLLRARAQEGVGDQGGCRGDFTAEQLAASIATGVDDRATLRELGGSHDLILSASLDPENRAFARALYARTGETSQRLLARLANPRGVIGRLDAQIFRLTVVGAWLLLESARPGALHPDTTLVTLRSLFAARESASGLQGQKMA